MPDSVDVIGGLVPDFFGRCRVCVLAVHLLGGILNRWGAVHNLRLALSVRGTTKTTAVACC